MTEWDQGYVEDLSELAAKLGGKVEITAGVYTVIHKASGGIVYSSANPVRVSGWLSSRADRKAMLQAPPPRRGRKPGSKSASKSAKKATRRAASKKATSEGA